MPRPRDTADIVILGAYSYVLAGTVGGALASGRRAAREILDAA